MHDEAPSDNFFASALDLLTCGLGAAALLFVLFSKVLSPQPAKTPSVPEYIQVEFFLTTDAGRDFQIVPFIQPPNGPAVAVPADALNRKDGRFYPGGYGGARGGGLQKLSSAVKTTGGYFLRGFSIDSDRAARVEGQSDVRRFRLLIQRPKPGQWQISAKVSTIAGNTSLARLDDAVSISVRGSSRTFKPPVIPATSIQLYQTTPPMIFEIPPEPDSAP